MTEKTEKTETEKTAQTEAGRVGAAAGRRSPVLDLDRIVGVLFDIDGVVTDTARVHAAAWKRVFDDYLQKRAARTGSPARPFDIGDYLRHVDGKPRLDGVRDFLASRRIALPEGDPADPPDADSVYGLGRRKDDYFLAELRRHGVAVFPSTVALVRELRRRGARTAAVSASRNAARVLATAGVAELFDIRVDGQDAAALHLAGKPDPALFLEAARRLGAPVDRVAVVEDALAGVEAGHRGGFGLVIGVGRGRAPADLLRSGADVVVDDLGQLELLGDLS